jgi:hypothetical protein
MDNSYRAPLKFYGAPYANFLYKNPMEISMEFSTKEKDILLIDIHVL